MANQLALLASAGHKLLPLLPPTHPPRAHLPPPTLWPPQLDPGNVHAHFNRGISHDKAGDHAAAVADFSACLSLDPLNSVAYYNRAAAYDALGQFDKAILDYRRALDSEK